MKEAAETWHWPSSSLRRPVTTACCVTISVLCLPCCPLPCQVDGTSPYSATLRQRRLPMFQFCSVFVTFALFYCFIYWPSVSAFLWVSCVVLGPLAGRPLEMVVLFFSSLCLCHVFFSSFLVLSSVWSYRVFLLLVHQLDTS